jgi:segregation and condensation protein A
VNYVVRLDQFEGPLDLLLHLIQKEEMDIYDIPIARITEQYLQQIELMEHLDLLPAGDFLVMAATLLRIKARMLLPRQPTEEEEGEDPREELIQRLIEYKKFKEAAAHLEAREEVSRNLYARPLDTVLLEEIQKIGPEETFEVSMSQLTRALQSVMARFEEVTTHDVELEPISIVDKGEVLRQLIGQHGRMTFRELFEKHHSRLEIIVTFIAMLELIKSGELAIHQADNTSELWIFAADATVTPEDLPAQAPTPAVEQEERA